MVTAFCCSLAGGASAQTVALADAWWTYQQDCNGDGCKAGTLPGDFARLNWDPVVTNCNGIVTAYEIVYQKPCASSTWTPIYTNAPHQISGCRSLGQTYVDIPMSANCACRDYQIAVYSIDSSVPDDVRSGAEDPDLSQHREQLLAEDFCLSDFFASCTAVSGASGSISDNNTHATREPGEPDHGGNSGGHSLWFCWTAPTNQPITFDTIGSSFDTLLAVYEGSSISNLTLVAASDDIAGATNRLSKVTFTPVAGVTYHIAVDGFGGAAGIVVLNWNQTGTALPDIIVWGASASPTVISRTFDSNECEVVEGCATPGFHRLLSFSTETRNIGAGDLILGDPSTNSLFHWASCHQHYHFEQYMEYNLLDTNGNIAATGHKVGFCLLDAHQRDPNASPMAKYNCDNQGLQVGWADVYGAGLPCQYIDVTSVVPGDYFLQLTVNPDNLFPESNTANNTAMVPVTIPPTECLSSPANDNFADGTIITNTPFSVSGFNNCATRESGEPSHLDNGSGHSLWYTWIPSSNQTAVVTTKRSDFDTVLAVYTGDSVSGLTLVASNDDIVPRVVLQSGVSFPAWAGTPYHIAVDGYSGAVGAAVLNINPPGNDDFQNATMISGTAGALEGSSLGASKEALEPAHAFDVGGHSVWYRWTAPASGPVGFNTRGSTFDTTLAVYTGQVVTNLALVAANDDDAESGGLVTSRLWFPAIAGTNYWIAVDGFAGETGDIKLSWNMESRLEIAPLPSGRFQITLTGVDWQRYTLLGSTDLLSWATNVPAITMSGGVHLFTNNPAASDPPLNLQFFRALLSP